MGGAFTAVADDATAPYWNPAGMIFLPYKEVIPQHAEKFGSLENQDYIGGVLPLGDGASRNSSRQAAIGFGIVRLAVDDIPVTPRPGDLKFGQFLDYGVDGIDKTFDYGEGDGKWEPGERILDINLFRASSSQIAELLSYARHYGPHLAFGGNLKFIQQSLPDTIPGRHVKSFGAGIDAGMLYMATDAVTVGVVVHDLTTTFLTWGNGVRERIDPTMDSGVAFNFYPADKNALTWAIDVGWGFDHMPDTELRVGAVTADVRTGLEYWYKNTFALRSGLNGKDLTFGAGVRYKHVGVDYALDLHRFFAAGQSDFPSSSDLDATHLVSASYSW
ncbi:MAG: hypothetical protein HY076_01850 [Candidatus Eisenbacteria bacterium]|uniref:Uncharacterized protein n=1 Tax=Eiseniibacteriota bacterium TaxID=2212470 RepID=A0A9D6QJB5_UNCEI|nr:hypothetical protein [Candidatus Eisenbacteria bacterium]